jgi:anti-sigma B factor antagonist
MPIASEKTDHVSVIEVHEKEIDASNSEVVKRQLKDRLEPDSNTVIDLSRVEFLDSSGIGVLISCMRHLSANGGAMKLCNVTKPALAILELVRFHRIADIYEDRDEAIRAFHEESEDL